MRARLYVTSTRIVGRALRACMRPPLWHGRRPGTTPGPDQIGHAPAEEGGERRRPHPRQHPVRHRLGVGVDAAVALGRRPPGRGPPLEHAGIVERHAVEAVGREVDHDGVPVLDERDRPPEEGFGCDVADDQADRSPREAGVGHQRDGDVPLAAEGRDPRGGVEELRHARCAPGPLVADHHHVVVLEAVGVLVQGLDQGALTVEHAGAAREDAVLHPALDAGDLEDRTAVGREVAAEQAEPAGVLEGLLDRVDHVLVRSRRGEPPELFGQGLARAGQRVTVEEAGLEELVDDDLQPALGVHVHHGVVAERSHVDQHRQAPGQLVEVVLAEHVAPQVDARRRGRSRRCAAARSSSRPWRWRPSGRCAATRASRCRGAGCPGSSWRAGSRPPGRGTRSAGAGRPTAGTPCAAVRARARR